MHRNSKPKKLSLSTQGESQLCRRKHYRIVEALARLRRGELFW